jgi:hypothetical protein
MDSRTGDQGKEATEKEPPSRESWPAAPPPTQHLSPSRISLPQAGLWEAWVFYQPSLGTVSLEKERGGDDAKDLETLHM